MSPITAWNVLKCCDADWTHLQGEYISPADQGPSCLSPWVEVSVAFCYICSKRAAAAKLLQSCPILCDPIDGSPPGFSVPGILRARTLETGVGCHCLLQCMKVKSESEVTQLCPTLCDPMDCSLPGFSIQWSFQARVLEWVAIAFSIKRATGIQMNEKIVNGVTILRKFHN